MYKNSIDPNSKADKKVNERGEAYNRAKVTVAQNQKEQELTQGALANVLMMQQTEASKKELLDLAAKLDLQQKMLDNDLMVMKQNMALGGLPQMPQPELPSMPPMDPMMGGDPMAMGGMPPPPPQGMGGMPPMDPMMAPAPPQGAPAGDYMMPPMM